MPASMQRLLTRLGRIAAQIDPAPEMTYRLAYGSFALRRLDAELAELVADSSDASGFAGVRGAGEVRMLTFERSGLCVEAQITQGKDRFSLIGQVVSGAGDDVRVETARGVQRAVVDEFGRFRMDDLLGGLLRLHLTSTEGATVITTWVTV